MALLKLGKVFLPTLSQPTHLFVIRKCHSVFGINKLMQHDKLANFTILPLTSEKHARAVEVLKKYYLPEHVLVRAKNMDLSDDRALDEYLVKLLRQGNSLYAKTEDDDIVGLCVNYASGRVDPNNLRNYAFYRQDPNTKEFLYFMAKLQETPNLWQIFKQTKIFEIKMVTVSPEYRRQGLATSLVERSTALARDTGHHVVRMDCINANDYKIAEHCMMQCIMKFPLHKLRGPNAPFIKKNSEYNRRVRVYVDPNTIVDAAKKIEIVKTKEVDLESVI